jgi:hypothetical protein
MRKLLVLVVVIVLIFLTGASTATCTLKSDEALVKDLVYRSAEAGNNNDYRAIYEMKSPNYKEIVSYEEFEEHMERVLEVVLAALGTTTVVELIDLKVRIEGSWAFATYGIVMEGGAVIPPSAENIYRKVEGKWYDVAETLVDPGYNEEDLPPGYNN